MRPYEQVETDRPLKAFSTGECPRVVTTRAGCLNKTQSTTMSSKSTTQVKAEESNGNQQRADHASDAFVVGIDQQGREHYFSRIRDCMTILSDGEHVQTQPLNGRPLKHWMAFINSDEQCGWDGETNVHSGSTFQHLADQLATAGNGGDTR
jgi:hypothetical protein